MGPGGRWWGEGDPPGSLLQRHTEITLGLSTFAGASIALIYAPAFFFGGVKMHEEHKRALQWVINHCTPPHTIRSCYGVRAQMLYMRHALTLDEIYDAHCGEAIPDGHLD